MLIDAPPTLLNTIIHKKHLSHFMAKTMNELAHKSPLIIIRTLYIFGLFF